VNYTKQAAEHIGELIEENPVIAGTVGGIAVTIYGLYKLVTYNPPKGNEEYY